MKTQILVLVSHTEDGYDLCDYQVVVGGPEARNKTAHQFLVDATNEEILEWNDREPESRDLVTTYNTTLINFGDSTYALNTNDGEGYYIHIVPPDQPESP